MPIAKANYSDYIRPLTIYPELGEVYATGAKIMAAMAPYGPTPAADADLKVNWTDGATAAAVNTTTYIHGATAPSVGDSFTYEWSLYAGIAEITPQSQTDFQRIQQTKSALQGVNSKWADDLIDGSGTDHTLMGFDTQIALAAAAGDASNSYTVSGVEANTMDLLIEASALLDTNEGVIITNTTGYKEIMHYALAAAGGAWTQHIGMTNLGFGNVPQVMGMPILTNRHIANVGNDTFFYMVNTTPGVGATVIVPANQAMFDLRGPIRDQANVIDVYHIILRSQVIYPTPRGVVKGSITTS